MHTKKTVVHETPSENTDTRMDIPAFAITLLFAIGGALGALAALDYFGGPPYPKNLFLALGPPFLLMTSVIILILGERKIVGKHTCCIGIFISLVGFALLVMALGLDDYIFVTFFGMALGVLATGGIVAGSVTLLSIGMRHYNAWRRK